MAFAVLCCGCQRLMDKKGKPSIPLLSDGGILTVTGIIDAIGANLKYKGPVAADFPDKKSADAAARKAGWSIKDAEGPNHRCPKCIAKAKRKKKPVGKVSIRDRAPFAGAVISPRGAYIEIPDR